MIDPSTAGDHPTHFIEEGAPKKDNNVVRLYSTETDDAIRPSEFSDDTLALRFTDQHVNVLRYVQKWGRWLKWDGKRWSFDETMHVFDMVRDTCRDQARRCNDPRVQTQLASAKTVAAVHRLAQMDQRTAGTVDQWDADPWLLNTPGGVIDLRTGTKRRCPVHRLRDQDDGGCTKRLMSEVPGVP